MPIIGVRELRQKTAEVLRTLKEEKTEYIITQQGQPVAILLPLDPEQVEEAILQSGKQSAAQGWESYVKTVARVQAALKAGTETQTVLDEIRR